MRAKLSMFSMKLPKPWIVALGTAVLAGSWFGYDAYHAYEQDKALEAQSISGSCSMCDAHKADLENLRQANEHKPQLSSQPKSATE